MTIEILCKLKLGCLAFYSVSHSIFLDDLQNILSLALCIRLDFPHPSVHGLSQCICDQPIDSIEIHLLCCAHERKHTITHYVIWDFFASIAMDVGFHVLHKQIHILLAPSFWSSWQQMDIVLITNGICTLANVIIIKLTHANLIFQTTSFWGVATTITIQAKVVLYCDQHSNDFILLIIKIFGCLHQQADNFFHQCANMAWLVKGFKGPPLSILRSFYTCWWIFKKFKTSLFCDMQL